MEVTRVRSAMMKRKIRTIRKVLRRRVIRMSRNALKPVKLPTDEGSAPPALLTLVTMSPAISAKEMRTMPKSSQAQTQSEPQKKPNPNAPTRHMSSMVKRTAYRYWAISSPIGKCSGLWMANSTSMPINKELETTTRAKNMSNEWLLTSLRIRRWQRSQRLSFLLADPSEFPAKSCRLRLPSTSAALCRSARSASVKVWKTSGLKDSSACSANSPERVLDSPRGPCRMSSSREVVSSSSNMLP
mmetsp:Transcript_30510/g.65758  ORF Transcript_30510/g.65758 Transcript_30510/m.65758 type:complete len:243 (-) Transcript_30510:297-1025(-)